MKTKMMTVLLAILSISSLSQARVIKTFKGNSPEGDQLLWAIQVQDRPFVCKLSDVTAAVQINLRDFVEDTIDVKENPKYETRVLLGANLGEEGYSRYWVRTGDKQSYPTVKLYSEVTPIYEIEYGIDEGMVRLRLYTDAAEKNVTKIERTAYTYRAVNLGTLRNPDVQAVPVFRYSMTCLPK